MPDTPAPTRAAATSLAIVWLLVGVWGATALLTAAAPQSPLSESSAPFMGPALMGFVFLHASLAYGWKGMLLMAASAFGIALGWESLSISTGFPFGFFEHTDEFGAKIGTVPIAVALGYFLYGYPAWLLTRLILGEKTPRWAMALAAAFIITQFDLTHDPVGATAHGFWHFRDVSGINGVPLSNFIGWLVTSCTIFAVWAYFAERFDRAPAKTNAAFWTLPIAMWLLTALQYPLIWSTADDRTVSAGEAVLPVSDIFETATINAILVMGFVVVIAAIRLFTTHAADKAHNNRYN